MAKKLKALASSVTENQLASTIRESAQQIWLAGLGAYAKTQEEGGKVFDALVKEGEVLQAKTRQVADEKIAEVADKTVGTWGRLEQVFEDRVARAVSSLGMPTRKDVEKLSKRVAELTEVVQQLTEAQQAEEAPRAKPVAAKAVRASKPAATAVAVAAPAEKKPVRAKKPAAEVAPAAEVVAEAAAPAKAEDSSTDKTEAASA
ncbi:phasin family protein [Craterilacuibacter sp. RT1T]|uniref:phasin family protein n=1 Tax=Craterilacuibacter sp. RT1T TaxID=2942211 RepID=UPI0020BE9024|nr:phasin family protein [Craterilacuibacter sp. RT1T]MCL6262430.1 phasin family protein [Craterilacuibacter sp. RT1T]